MRDPLQIIQRLRLSEKATLGQENNNEFVFQVDRKATKVEVRQAVERLFDVKVESVNTCNYDGKKRRERRANYGRTAHWKKAIVKLADGETIELV